ncbi:MAG: hypothetical protein JWP83_3140 [Mycobacterium sp.]|jgi:hypothetical protein|nr:hypothetical protein [Mycobacterium sp.]
MLPPVMRAVAQFGPAGGCAERRPFRSFWKATIFVTIGRAILSASASDAGTEPVADLCAFTSSRLEFVER